MREQAPVAWSDANGGYWIISGYDAVFEAARDDDVFSSARSSDGGKGLTVVIPETPMHLHLPIELDPVTIGGTPMISVTSHSPRPTTWWTTWWTTWSTNQVHEKSIIPVIRSTAAGAVIASTTLRYVRNSGERAGCGGPWSSCRTPPSVPWPRRGRVCARVGRDRCGPLVDTRHLVRSGGPPADPAGLGAHEIACVQLADAAPGSADDLEDESRRCRLLPGEGVVDFHAVAAALADAGYDGPLGPEVLSAGSDARSPEDVAEACFCSVQAFFPA